MSMTPNFFPPMLRYWNLHFATDHHDQLTRVNTVKMAAFVKAINAKIRSNPVLDYVCSTRKFSLLSRFAAGQRHYNRTIPDISGRGDSISR